MFTAFTVLRSRQDSRGPALRQQCQVQPSELLRWVSQAGRSVQTWHTAAQTGDAQRPESGLHRTTSGLRVTAEAPPGPAPHCPSRASAHPFLGALSGLLPGALPAAPSAGGWGSVLCQSQRVFSACTGQERKAKRGAASYSQPLWAPHHSLPGSPGLATTRGDVS